MNGAKGFESRCLMIPVSDGAKADAAAELAEIPVSKIKPTPKVGETLVILHEVKRSKEGAVLGLQRNSRPEKAAITAVYLDGSVRTGTSDHWECKPGKLGQWETINPDRVEK